MKNFPDFDTAFAAYWKLLEKHHKSGEIIRYYTSTKDERRQLERIDEKKLRLREMTDVGKRTQQTRERKKPLPPDALSAGNEYNWKFEELKLAFRNLYNRRDELSNFKITQVPGEFKARGYVEYGRDMFNEFCLFIGEE